MAMIDKKPEIAARRRKLGPMGLALNAAVLVAAVVGALLLLGGN